MIYPPPVEIGFDHIDYLKKAYTYEKDTHLREHMLVILRNVEAQRDYFTGSIVEIKNLVQYDRTPNDLKEAKWEIYKISISSNFKCGMYF